MTEDELAHYAEALAASASFRRVGYELRCAEAETMLVVQGLSAAGAKAAVEYALAHRWLVEDGFGPTAVLRPGPRALFRP